MTINKENMFVKVWVEDDGAPLILASDFVKRIYLRDEMDCSNNRFVSIVVETNDGDEYPHYAAENWCAAPGGAQDVIDYVFKHLSNRKSVDMTDIHRQLRLAREQAYREQLSERTARRN